MGSSHNLEDLPGGSTSPYHGLSNGALQNNPTGNFGPSARLGRTQTGIEDEVSSADSDIQDKVWSQQNLLSLDGGGIRGYWTLLVLERLMETIASEERKLSDHHLRAKGSFAPQSFPPDATQGALEVKEREAAVDAHGNQGTVIEFYGASRKFLPCHYFDYICGSSTGGLIAIMLGRFRMPVYDCLREYEKMGHEIFGKPRLISQRNLGLPWPKYSAIAMEKAIKDVTARRCEHNSRINNVQFPSRPSICKTFITAYQSRKTSAGFGKKTLYLFRSYDHEAKEDISVQYNNQRINTGASRRGVKRKNYGQADALQIWEVARAGTAAPFYFKEIVIKRHDIGGKTKAYFSDGGFGYTNNPTQEGILEVESLHGSSNVGVVVSVGTARGTKPTSRGLFSRLEESFETATDPETVHNNLEGRDFYWRFNDYDQGLDVALDEWRPNTVFTKTPGRKTLEKIKAGYNRWAAKDENVKQIKKCAKELVRRRVIRSKNESRWEAYSTGAEFPCTYSECNSAQFEDRSALASHLEEKHSLSQEEASRSVEKMTRRWRYQTPSSR